MRIETRSWAALAVLSFAVAGIPCWAEEAASKPRSSVDQLAEGVYRHLSYGPAPDNFTTNGLLVVLPKGEVLMIDTAWDAAQTREVLDWSRRHLGKLPSLAWVTHSHADSMGGLPALRELGIPAYALDLTVERAGAEGAGLQVGLRRREPWRADPLGFEVFFPGAGHAPDNIVVYVPGSKVLFGGCLVKSAAAKGLGYTGDADLESWPKALAALLERYKEARWVVPGHQEVGDLGAVRHSIDLLQKK
jgi:metallo-beta-lactamase class B